MNLLNLKIALDLDDTLFDFLNCYKLLFPNSLKNEEITRNVYKLRNNKLFWENLPLIESPNFEAHIYATKRINSKTYTKNCLIKNNLPIKPIYQMYYQNGNKADMIKGRCDVLIDDNISNVTKSINSGLPALLITRNHNKDIDFKFRINKLDIEEIRSTYEFELSYLKWN